MQPGEKKKKKKNIPAEKKQKELKKNSPHNQTALSRPFPSPFFCWLLRIGLGPVLKRGGGTSERGGGWRENCRKRDGE